MVPLIEVDTVDGTLLPCQLQVAFNELALAFNIEFVPLPDKLFSLIAPIVPAEAVMDIPTPEFIKMISCF